MKKNKTIAFIFARGGSKGIPKKNIISLGGKPLIQHTIEIALASNLIDRLIVSTDDAEIAKISELAGAETPFLRPASLSEDNSPEWLAWQHAINYVQDKNGIFDIFVSLPTTSPLRSLDDINLCIRTIEDNSDCDIVITINNSKRNPYFNMVSLNDDGFAELAIKSKIPIVNRQRAPKLFEVTTVAYVSRPNFILNSKGIFEGRVKTVLIPDERSLDIDTHTDLAFAEYLISKR